MRACIFVCGASMSLNGAMYELKNKRSFFYFLHLCVQVASILIAKDGAYIYVYIIRRVVHSD